MAAHVGPVPAGVVTVSVDAWVAASRILHPEPVDLNDLVLPPGEQALLDRLNTAHQVLAAAREAAHTAGDVAVVQIIDDYTYRHPAADSVSVPTARDPKGCLP